ncbi:MAG: hypothetical protein R3C19_04190 [Planctomycetaceae bacterium]
MKWIVQRPITSQLSGTSSSLGLFLRSRQRNCRLAGFAALASPRRSQRRGLKSATLCLLVVLGALSPAVAVAQSGEDVAKGLLRALIESQLERSNRRGAPRDSLRPPQGRPQLTSEMQQLRPIIGSVAQESATLAALLNNESRRSIEIRQRLPDAIRFQAAATALKQQADVQNDHRLLLDGFRGLNSDWQTLSHQLHQCRGLSADAGNLLQRIDQLDGQYCSLLGIQEQFDVQELSRSAYVLTAYLRDLDDELDRAAPPPGVGRGLAPGMRRLRQKADYFAGLISSGVPLPTAVAEFKSLNDDWTAMQDQLRRYTDHSVVRSTQRIQETLRTLHQILRLPVSLDKNLLLHLVHDADTEMSELFRTITLEQMMNLPDSESIAAAADAAYGSLQNLDDVIHRDENPQVIAEAWVYADESWKLLSYYLQPVRDVRAQTQIRTVSQSLQALRETLGITLSFDRNALVQSAASLENLAEHLVTAIQRWQSRPGEHDRSLVARAQAVVSQCHDLEQSLLANRDRNRLQRECDQVVTAWQSVRPELKKCDTPERESLDHVASSFTPELIRLRTLLDD